MVGRSRPVEAMVGIEVSQTEVEAHKGEQGEEGGKEGGGRRERLVEDANVGEVDKIGVRTTAISCKFLVQRNGQNVTNGRAGAGISN